METITARRLSLSGVLVLPVVLVALGIWILTAQRVLGAVWLAASAALLLVALGQVLVPPRVALAPDGLHVRTGGRSRTYAWVDCVDFHVWQQGRRSSVAFAYAGHEGGELSDADARRAQADRALPALAGIDGADVLARIEAYRQGL